jgi:hypothetical protein
MVGFAEVNQALGFKRGMRGDRSVMRGELGDKFCFEMKCGVLRDGVDHKLCDEKHYLQDNYFTYVTRRSSGVATSFTFPSEK